MKSASAAHWSSPAPKDKFDLGRDGATVGSEELGRIRIPLSRISASRPPRCSTVTANRLTRYMLIVLALPVVLLLPGCGTESEVPEKKTEAKLVALVSAAIDSDGELANDAIQYADYTLARQQLGLADDANIYNISPTFLLDPLIYATRPDAPPLVGAIDGSSVQAAAGRSMVGATALVALRTTQPFSEIAKALSEAGYVERRGLLVSPRDGSHVVFPVVADAGGSVVVLGESPRFVRGVLESREPNSPRTADLIDSVSGPRRMATSLNESCAVAAAAGQNLSPRDGEYLLQVEGDASDAEQYLLDRSKVGQSGGIVFGEPDAEGDVLRVEFTYTDTSNSAIGALPLDDGRFAC